MKTRLNIIKIVTLILVNNTLMASIIPNNPNNLVFSFNIGPIWSREGKTQTFNLQPDIEKTYLASKKNKSMLGGELFVGRQRALYSNVLGQLGIAIATTTPTRLAGDIWEDADPEFDNFIYYYDIKHTGLAVKGKLLFDYWQFLTPYLHSSIGIGFNRSQNFTIRSKLCEEIPGPPFQSNNTTSFSYTLGIGLQKNMDTNWKVGVGYEFTNWGQSRLNKAVGQTLNEGLNLNHFYTNQLQFSLNYQF